MVENDIEGILAVDRKITGQNRALTYATLPNNFLGGELAMSLVAEVGDRIVGFLLGQRATSETTDVAVVQIMGVDPAYLHQRIGTRLMETFFEACRKRGVNSVHSMVSVHDWWMLSFLRSLDFTHGEMVELVKPLGRG
jgi:GNAT superfamily N-acetyltransferase